MAQGVYLKAPWVAQAQAWLDFLNAQPPDYFANEPLSGGVANASPFDLVLTPAQHTLLSPAFGAFLDACYRVSDTMKHHERRHRQSGPTGPTGWAWWPKPRRTA